MLSSKAKMFSENLYSQKPSFKKSEKDKSSKEKDSSKQLWVLAGVTVASIFGLGYFAIRTIGKSEEFLQKGVKNTKNGIDKLIKSKK